MKFSFAKLTKVPETRDPTPSQIFETRPNVKSLAHLFESLILRSPVHDISKCPPTPKSSSHPKWVGPVSGIAKPISLTFILFFLIGIFILNIALVNSQYIPPSYQAGYGYGGANDYWNSASYSQAQTYRPGLGTNYPYYNSNQNLYRDPYYGGDYSYNNPNSNYQSSSIYSNRNQYYNSYSNMYPTSSYGRNPYLSSGYGGYYQPFPSQTYLQGQGIDLYRNFDDEQCGLGQDFLIQQAPFGCSPSVVRSDLLEEQNVPVFCQLAATKLNPLIDVDAIYSMEFRRDKNFPEDVVGVGFHPARAAVRQTSYLGSSSSYGASFSGRTGSLLNSAVMNNVGYAVVVLKQQPNEKDMPDSISGNLTAVLRYDVKNAFGVGNVEFALPQVDDLSWNEDYRKYSFWKGRGFLRADLVEPDRAVISIMSDQNLKIDTVSLTVGQTAREVRMPGFYCFAKAEVKLDRIGFPDTTARLRIDNDYVDLVADQRFLDDRCRVQFVEKNGLSEFAQIRCSEDDGATRYYEFQKSPRVVLKINDVEGTYKVGEPLSLFGTSYYVVRAIEQNDENGKISIVLDSSLTPYNYRSYPSLTSSSSSYLYNNNLRIDLGETLDLSDDNKIQFLSLSEGVNEDFSQENDVDVGNYNSVFKENYDNAIADYSRVASDFANELMEPGFGEAGKTYGEEALERAAYLAEATGQILTSKEFIDKMKDEYGELENENELRLLADESLFYSEEETSGVMIDGRLHIITFLGASKPRLSDFSAKFFVKNTQTNKVDDFVLGKDGRREFDRGNNRDQIILRYLDEFSADIDYIGEEYIDANLSRRNISRRFTVFRDRPITIGNGKYTLSVENINFKNVAYVRIEPKLEDIRTEANFSINIGIEKRAIKLSPEQTENRINKANETLEKLNKISDGLGKVVKGTKAACLATGGFLITKNFLQNLGGKQIARQQIMRSQGGWQEFCRQAIADNDGNYASMDDCFNKNADAIDADVETLNGFIQKQNDEIKAAKGTQGASIFGNDYYDNDEYVKNYLPGVKSDIEAYGKDIVDPNNPDRKITSERLASILEQKYEKEGGYSIEQARDVQLYARILNSEEVSADSRLYKMTQKNLYDTAALMDETTQGLIDADTLQNDFASKGFPNINIHSYGKKNSVTGIYSGGTVLGSNIKGVELTEEEKKKSFAFEPFYYGNEKYVALLDGSGGNRYNIKNVYKLGDVGAGNVINVASASDEATLKQQFRGFEKFDVNSYNNVYKSPEARFYEAEPYKGFPAVVPFDTTKGWYAATKQTIAAFGSLGAFDDSGRISSFWLCNVGSNGLEEFNTGFGDDNCQQINIGTNQPYGEILGLPVGEASRLVGRAIRALESASSQRQGNVNIKYISIEGQRIKVGNPAANIPQMQCQDFMSPKDCHLLFNVCDPVICPSSRCNLGGNYNVPNVIQSGIIGSIALCLPNYKEGIAVPVCLSGVNAGVQSLQSIYQNYHDCLRESLDTGRQTGICDEIHSIYLCDFFWQQATPIAKIGIPKLIGSLLGEGTRGGGEYLGVQSAWEGASNSMDYFTKSYAENSYNAFKVRSTDEVGTQVCKNFASLRFPDVIDNLIEPDSPPQYNAWFDEIPLTTATVPATSQYKVFYHIFGGKDFGSYYTVYLKSASGTSFFETPGRLVVASGYIDRGGYASDTLDFTQSAGYSELCVSVNAQEECGFQKVSTSFALDYLSNKYLNEQASATGIMSESECVSGSSSLYSLAQPNLQQGVDEVINPQLYNYGIVRVCSTDNPGNRNDPKTGTDASRWRVVGNCDGSVGKVQCWVDTRSVKENIDIKYLEKGALDSIDANYMDFLNGTEGFMDQGEVQSQIESIDKGTLSDNEKINTITDILDKVVFSHQKAYLLLLRGDAYKNLAIQAYTGIKSKLREKDSVVPVENPRPEDKPNSLPVVEVPVSETDKKDSSEQQKIDEENARKAEEARIRADEKERLLREINQGVGAVA